ncbi:hypothetical protein GCM10007172_05220 [Sinomonas atrocyanea]|nr:hypothetical protein GCM10007172_05220 [Sinomonas atrocyanea]
MDRVNGFIEDQLRIEHRGTPIRGHALIVAALRDMWAAAELVQAWDDKVRRSRRTAGSFR